MGRGKARTLSVVALFSLGGIGVKWHSYASGIYPYSIGQPSSFRQIVLRTASNVEADYFFAPVPSNLTNLNIKAVPGHILQDEVATFRDLGGHHVRINGYMRLAGQREPLMRADFRTPLAGRYVVERVSFVSHGLVWHITASYEQKFSRLRSTLLRMMQSFRIRA